MDDGYTIRPKELPPHVGKSQAEQVVDVFVVGLLKRAGMKVKVTKTRNSRTIQVKLPK